MLPNFISAIENTTEKKAPDSIIMSGKEIHSLDELRENFNVEDTMRAFKNGSLKAFLKSHYYERESDSIARLSADSKDFLQRICLILGVDYLNRDSIIPPESEARLEMLRQFTNDENILQKFAQIALNQKELAELLDSGEKEIYLCHNKFSIPLSKTNTIYIGVDNPEIENPFTYEQYKKAGITIKNIDLPDVVSDEMSEYALNIAKRNGYDDYADQNSPLATYFHNALKSHERFYHTRLPYDSSAAHKEFNSEYAAKQALKEYLRKPYDTANALVSTNNSKCLAKSLSDEYSKIIEDCFYPVMDNLKILFSLKHKEKLYTNLENLVKNSKKTLSNAFSREIIDNQDYYDMYDFDYFVDRVTIEEHDYRTSEGVLKVIESLFPDSIEYTYDDFLDAIYEMEEDINNHTASFFKVAYNEYLAYIRQIERIFEVLGKNYPQFSENEDIFDYLARICPTD